MPEEKESPKTKSTSSWLYDIRTILIIIISAMSILVAIVTNWSGYGMALREIDNQYGESIRSIDNRLSTIEKALDVDGMVINIRTMKKEIDTATEDVVDIKRTIMLMQGSISVMEKSQQSIEATQLEMLKILKIKYNIKE